MELLTILLLLVFLLEEGLKLALLSLKFLKRLGKIRKQFREEKCLSRLTHAQAVPIRPAGQPWDCPTRRTSRQVSFIESLDQTLSFKIQSGIFAW